MVFHECLNGDETLTVDELIQKLQEIRKEAGTGNVPVMAEWEGQYIPLDAESVSMETTRVVGGCNSGLQPAIRTIPPVIIINCDN